MINGFALETDGFAKRDDALRRAARERLAAVCDADGSADRDGSVVATAPAARRMVPRLIGFLPALRLRGVEWI